MADIEPAGQSPATVAGPGFSLSGLINVFVRPERFLEKLKDNPRIIVPYIAVVIVGFIGVYAVADILARTQIEQLRAMEFVPADRIPSLSQLKVRILAFAPVGSLLSPLAVAVLFMVWGNFVMGGRAGFKQILSLALYSEFVFTSIHTVELLLAAAKGSMDVSLSLGILVIDRGMDSLPYVILSKIGVKHFWQIVILGIGARKYYGMDSNKGYVLAVLTIGTLALIHIGFAAIGQLFKP
jgi:hypothetical protein